MQGIYAITEKSTGRSYIGQSKNIEARWKKHVKELNSRTHHNYRLQRAWGQAGGMARFEFQILEEVEDSSQLDHREAYWIKQFGGLRSKDTFNIASPYRKRPPRRKASRRKSGPKRSRKRFRCR